MKNIFLRIFGKVLRAYDRFRTDEMKRQFRYCGKNVFVETTVVVWPPSGLHIEDNAAINGGTFIFASGGVEVGAGTLISAGCIISSVAHPKNSAERWKQPLVFSKVSIGKNVWIGAGAMILPGVAIGDNAIVGAGAVVTKNVGVGAIVAGNPARILGEVTL